MILCVTAPVCVHAAIVTKLHKSAQIGSVPQNRLRPGPASSKAVACTGGGHEQPGLEDKKLHKRWFSSCFYTKDMACVLCKTRREKRHCPGVHGEICAICCGEQREETIQCPLDCEYLREAHLREPLHRNTPDLPNRDYPIPADFVNKNLPLIVMFQKAILHVALERDAIDYDVREALEGLVRTYQTLGSGLYYESRPVNPIAAAIFDQVQTDVAELRRLEADKGLHKLLDSHVLTILIFLQRAEYGYNNGRKKGRCFLGEIETIIDETTARPKRESESLIVT